MIITNPTLYTGNTAYLSGLTSNGKVTPALDAIDTVNPIAEDVSFGTLLAEAMGNTVATDATHKIQTDSLVLGEDSDLHTISIAAQKAELMLNLTVQVRNKIVESYQEISRMQM